MDDHTVIGRALAIIDATLDGGSATSLAELSRLTQIPKPTVRRIANTLASRGLLVLSADGYTAGPRLITDGIRAAQHQKIRTASTPYLQELFERGRACVWLVDATNIEHMHLVSSIYDRLAIPYSDDWLRNLSGPLILCSALGQVALSARRDKIEELFRLGLPRLTPHTPTQPRQLVAAFARTASEGVAIEHQQLRLGWSCLAVPVNGPGHSRAVLGVVDHTHRFDSKKLRRLAVATAADVSKDWSNQRTLFPKNG